LDREAEDGGEDLVAQVGEALARLQQALTRLDAAAAAYMGVSATDLQSLAILLRHGGTMTAGQLAAESRLTPGSITALIDRLEREGYAQRVRGETDRRTVMVELTPRAYELADETYGDIAAAGRDLARGLSRRDLIAIRDFLDSWCAVQLQQVERLAPCGEEGADSCVRPEEGSPDDA